MHEAEIIDERAYYSRIRLWAGIPANIKTRAWLDNFEAVERPYALALLDSFLYFNTDLTDKLFTTAFHSLAAHVCSTTGVYAARKSEWLNFRSEVLITHPTGERPNATDSGYLFDRKARQLLSLPESRIAPPEDVLTWLVLKGSRPVVFVDDFAGSGDQFIKTWQRVYQLPTGDNTSFAEQAKLGRVDRVYYSPAVCTEYAAARIRSVSGKVTLNAGHVLPSDYGAAHPETVLFPAEMRAEAVDVIRQASERAGVHRDDCLGYHDLGLALAFEHSVPDASLPIFWTSTANWTALMRRR